MERASLIPRNREAEVILITNAKKKKNIVKVEVGGHMVDSKRTIKYLGVMIDAKLNFMKHLKFACQKAANTS